MRGLKISIISILFLFMSSISHSQVQPPPAQERLSQPQEQTADAKEDDRLPIQKEGWQFFLAPYLWIPGAHLNLSHQGRFSGTTVADIPWYQIVPLLFSKAIGGMGRVEIWKGKWGLFSDTNFIYIGDSVSAGGARDLKLNIKQAPGAIPVRLQLSGDLKFWSRVLWQDIGVRFLAGTVPLNADKPLPMVSCELLGGFRYTYFNQASSLGVNATVSAPGNVLVSRSGSFFDSVHLSIAEPMVGFRLGFWFTPKVNLLLRADCGGFGFVAYNNVDSVIEALVGYQVHKNFRIYGGYRGRYSAGSANNKDIAIHGWFHGPMLGLVFGF